MPRKKKSDTAAAQAAESAQPMSKSDFIRSLPTSMTTGEVIAKAKEAGFEVSHSLVYMTRNKPKPSKRRGRPAGASRRPVAARTRTTSATSIEAKFADIVAEIGLARAEEMLRSVRAKFTAAAR